MSLVSPPSSNGWTIPLNSVYGKFSPCISGTLTSFLDDLVSETLTPFLSKSILVDFVINIFPREDGLRCEKQQFNLNSRRYPKNLGAYMKNQSSKEKC